MSTQSNDSLNAIIDSIKGVLGLTVLHPSSKTTGTVSTPLYVDSNSQVAQGNVPFPFTAAGLVVSGTTATTVSALSVTAQAETDNSGLLMSGQLVGGSRVTTWTKTGFIRVNVTDSAGVLTDGDHYIQIGTLS